MNLCKTIFQKDLYDLTIDDLTSFFVNPQEESSNLEFKSGKIELEDIYREVGAFLNTEGGLLIIGAPIEKKTSTGNGKEKKVCHGSLCPTEKIKGQDNLLRSIASNISPSPYKIKIKEFDYESGKVFVLEIPQSLTPPHQVNLDGKYYIRLEREAKSAPHGIVEALFFRRQKPNLNLQIRSGRLKKNLRTEYVELVFTNESLVTAENVGFMIEIDGILEVVSKTNINRELVIKKHNLQYQDLYKDAILVKGISFNLSIDFNPKNKIVLVNCTYYCKDGQAEKKMVIIDTSIDDRFIKTYDSKQTENEMTPQEFSSYYSELEK